MKLQAGLPDARSGRPGQRSEVSTGAGSRSSFSLWLAPSSAARSGAGWAVVGGSTLSTEPSTLFGR